MATGGEEDIDTKLCCAICLEPYRRPKMLRCYHSFCQSCLQGVAGSSPSFPCPSCREIMLLPPGGVGALQTNFYVVDNLAATSSSPPRRLCDVCTDDREATHSCLQCQQRYCLPCRKNHDSFSACRGHTVVSLTQEEEEGCGKGIPLSDKHKVEMCTKHLNQQLLFHCTKCQADLCLQCKLTQHEGHPTEDLADTRSKVKDKLKDRLGTLTQDIQQVDHLVSAFEDRCTKLQQQKQTTEQDFRARADTLHQWVNQSLDEAISSIQSSSEQLAKPWQDQAEQLRHKKLALEAQQDHILQVLKDGKEADLVSLEAQLSSGPMEGVDVEELRKELTKDIPSFRVEHNTTAVNQPQLRTFIGVLEPVQQTAGAEETVLPSQHSCGLGKASGSDSVKGSDVMHTTHSAPSASSCVGVMGKKPPREFIYSRNPESVVFAMCPISHNRLWVLYRPAGGSAQYLKLFDAEGQVLTTVQYPGYCNGLLTITDDVLLCWKYGDSTVRLITPDGSLSTYDMGMEVWGMVSSATNDIHYLGDWQQNSLHRVTFTSVNTDQTDSGLSGSALCQASSPGTPHQRNQLTHSVKEVVFEKYPEGILRHVSAGGRYFAFLDDDTVMVYRRAGSGSFAILCSYNPTSLPCDARFVLIDDNELLLVVVEEESKVHIIDHEDGGCFVRCLDTGPLELDAPTCLATDFNQHVWIGCYGGKVVVVDL
ncbi:uncharacterized protein LOC143276921 isoform X1 [Babylonia areolata]|uniref:uncharacterized protein LOC143276921 isoform X1 n=1 Tax=Babylonia areolata TaxID=304850 RepID=UPI003FCFCF36